MGGGSRYPYPKQVWSPAGGWWGRPANWRTNTAVAFAGILVITYGAWNISAEHEWRYTPPIRDIPSMKWAKQYAEPEVKKSE